MAIVYDPKAVLKEAAPDQKIKRMVSRRLDLKKAALSFVDAIPFLKRSAVSSVALKTIREYKARIKREAAESGRDDARDLERELSKSPMQLINRVQNAVVFQVASSIKDKYKGERYEWLPSDAEEPDPEHQLKYGQIFTVGEGEMPGERYGCRCGMRILVNENELELD